MPQTVEVRFKGIRREFFLWPDDQDPLRRSEAVVVECLRGQDLGLVQSAGEAAEKKCGSCSSCGVGAGVAEGRAGGRVVEADDSAAGDDPEARRASDSAGEAGSESLPITETPPGSQAPEFLAEALPETPDAEAASRRADKPAEFRSVLRRATQDDIRVSNLLRRAEEDDRRRAMDKVRDHRIDMKLSDAEWQWDKSKLTLYFTAEKRVDFRALVRDLAAVFRARIELRQIGVRDEAARLGGVGRCGREYCCSTWLTELSPVSLALAKDQHLSLNPAQISGGCGRLLCCLKYEHEFYVAARKRFPREGKTVAAGRGLEKVIAVDIFRERVFLRNLEGSRIIPLVQLKEEMADAATGSLGDSSAQLPDGPPASLSRAAPPQRTEPPRRRVAEPTSRRAAEPPSQPPAPPVAEPTNESAPRKRRRRRGRRGRGGNSPGGPPPSSSPGS
jgi:cell fate regulator YaaT (PSP1 superfamily)